MAKRLIFVSCGQETEDEKALGIAVKEVIDASEGFEAYFAETVHDFDSLSRNIFDALRRCSGVIAFLHDRGTVTRPSGKDWGVRSSVWINQELAILAYRQFFESTQIPVLVFIDPKVKLEGAMTELIVNPQRLLDHSNTVEKVRLWLKGIASASSGTATDDVFDEKWRRLSPTAIRVIACLIGEGGEQVKESSIKRRLRERDGMSGNEASAAVRSARLEFINTDLVKLVHNLHSGDEMTVHPTWKWHLRRAVARAMSPGDSIP